MHSVWSVPLDVRGAKKRQSDFEVMLLLLILEIANFVLYSYTEEEKIL